MEKANNTATTKCGANSKKLFEGFDPPARLNLYIMTPDPISPNIIRSL